MTATKRGKRIVDRKRIYALAREYAAKHGGNLPSTLQAYALLGRRGSYTTIGRLLKDYANESRPTSASAKQPVRQVIQLDIGGLSDGLARIEKKLDALNALLRKARVLTARTSG